MSVSRMSRIPRNRGKNSGDFDLSQVITTKRLNEHDRRSVPNPMALDLPFALQLYAELPGKHTFNPPKSFSTHVGVQATKIALGKSPGTQPNLYLHRVLQTKQCAYTAIAMTHTIRPRFPFRISRRSRQGIVKQSEALHGHPRGKHSRQDPSTPTLVYGKNARHRKTTRIHQHLKSGNASRYWRDTKRNARALRTRGQERCLRRVAETRQYGSGKVITEFNHGIYFL